ncbi:DUF2977 domain-containing protein, partial [Staphylococcus aureus]
MKRFVNKRNEIISFAIIGSIQE